MKGLATYEVFKSKRRIDICKIHMRTSNKLMHFIKLEGNSSKGQEVDYSLSCTFLDCLTNVIFAK